MAYSSCLLIVGLGNPGEEYDDTRHNVGFWAVKAYAKKNEFVFRYKSGFLSRIAQKEVNEKKIILQLPETYMNESGKAVAIVVKNFNISPNNVLVVVDNVDLSTGELRLKASGGTGGHNGLKSIAAALGTDDYMRLWIGISGRDSGELSGHVLGRLNAEEKNILNNVQEKVVNVLSAWVTDGLEGAQKIISLKTSGE